MTDPNRDYWTECVSSAAEECGAGLTSEQVEEIAHAVALAHENYGMAFYQPPPSDRIAVVREEERARLESLRREYENYRDNAETAIKKALGQRRDSRVFIEPDGQVVRLDGRMEVIQW